MLPDMRFNEDDIVELGSALSVQALLTVQNPYGV